MNEARISRRGLLGAAGAVGVAAGAGLLGAPALAGGRGYRWDNVEVVGGGFVPGIVFNQSEPGLVYARTDIGGAYRWQPSTSRWVPLLDWVGWEKWGWSGVASLATDARDPDRVYAAVGTYTNDWDPNNGAILRSRDRGRTWKVTELPFKLGGNMPGRGMGERLAIDPHRNEVLYLGAPSGQGLWRSTDHGERWARVTAFPNPGTYRADPNDTSGYSSDLQGVVWVVFDPRTGGRRRRTQTIYAGVADKDNPLYRSTDGGVSWAAVPGAPTGHVPHKGVLDHVGGYLYLATSDTGGPYDGGSGKVWKLDTATDAWTDVTPENGGWGYSGLTIDRQRPGTLLVATQIAWWPDVVFFRTTDGGASWTRSWDWGDWPNRIKRYDLDITDAPWLTWNATPPLPEEAPKLGWMTESLEIDPFDSDRLLYGTGATVYATDNLTDWDTGGTVHIEVRARGLEETAVLDLVSPPVGAHLISALGDVGGFVHHDFAQPGLMFANPTHGSTTGLDFAALVPGTVVRVGNPTGGERFGISYDGGATWTPAASQPDGITGGGKVAVNAEGTRVLWSPDGVAVHCSTDGGATWAPSSGVPAGVRVEADRVDPARMYAFAAGTFHVSADGGATFTAGATGLPAEGDVRFQAVPGFAGHIWLAGGKTGGVYGMWRSTDGGSTFTQVAGVDEADNVGFGKAAPHRPYPAIFTSAKVRGVRGIFRSDDAGRHWIRLNDDRHQWAWTGAVVIGDPRVHGRVYVGTNGRGIIVGEPH
ncbi:xyloglucanase [Catellatospora methionotrophica]|uniref:Xyloglucanase n=1 Tax=Catellatospora methionotrophica TaxID=121620 RepID=A0A8J3PER9_9ACTN|nr:sialidase family protein [Catellatospora methionotrophica]GIG13954.1 xyloglucanase [Catellatospora methionotrophica]